jgi:hypothetical protein
MQYVNMRVLFLQCLMHNNIFYSKDSTYYQGKIIMQLIERVACKKDQAGESKNIFLS